MTVKSKLTILSLLVAVLATSFASVSAYADEGNLDQLGAGKHMGEMKTALEEGDYDTAAEMYQNRTGQELSQEQFQTMQQAHTMMQEGETESAKELLEGAGIEPPEMHQKGMFMEDLTEEQQEVFEDAMQMLEDAEIPFPPKGGHFGKGGCKLE